MYIIDDIIISDSVKEEYFVCDLGRCKGACCVAGESGAPLEKEETEILLSIQNEVRHYLSEEGKTAINRHGAFIEKEEDGKIIYETPLISKEGACAYVQEDKNGISYCGIEKAYFDGKISFRKPVSCHLYPIRVTEYDGFTAVNKEDWPEVCVNKCAAQYSLKVPLYQFVKEALIRKFGKGFFDVLHTMQKSEE